MQRGWHEFASKSLQFFELLARIDANGLRAFDNHVTHDALQQIQVLMQYRSRRKPQRSGLDACPGFSQVSDVFG